MANNITFRWALGLEYDGQPFFGWQAQPSGNTVQDRLEYAIAQIACEPISSVCAGRTDTGVHALSQIVHFNTHSDRSSNAWIRGVNCHLPKTIRVLWAQPVDQQFHARYSACKRHYRYVLYNAPVRPALYQGKVGWTHHELNEICIRKAMAQLIGTHDFSAFRSSECQAKSPVKTIYNITLIKEKSLWIFDFEASGFLHHMIRNIIGTLVAIGKDAKAEEWIRLLLEQKDRKNAPPTFSPDGLYLTQIEYPNTYNFAKPEHMPFD